MLFVSVMAQFVFSLFLPILLYSPGHSMLSPQVEQINVVWVGGRKTCTWMRTCAHKRVSVFQQRSRLEKHCTKDRVGIRGHFLVQREADAVAPWCP